MLHRTSPSRGPGSPRVTGFYEPDTGSCQYLCVDEATGTAGLIDVVQEFDPAHAETRFDSAAWALERIAAQGLRLEWILDTHPHADHLMAAAWLKQRTGVPMAIGQKVADIAALWREIYHLPDAFHPDRHFDRLFADGERFMLGSLPVQVLLSPGHTLGSVTYVIGDAIFAHDTFMQPDAGTARCDFPGGSAAVQYDTLMRLLAFPDDHRIFVGHDYGTEARPDPAWESTVGEQKRSNKHVGGGVAKVQYVAVREARDRTLPLPARMLFALQVNLRGGRLPPPEEDGRSYFKIPANRFHRPGGTER